MPKHAYEKFDLYTYIYIYITKIYYWLTKSDVVNCIWLEFDGWL